MVAWVRFFFFFFFFLILVTRQQSNTFCNFLKSPVARLSRQKTTVQQGGGTGILVLYTRVTRGFQNMNVHTVI